MRLGRSGNVSAIPGLSKKKLRREGSELVGRKVRLSHLVVQKPIGFIIETMGGGNLCLAPTFVDDTVGIPVGGLTTIPTESTNY